MSGEYAWKRLCTALSSGLYSTLAKHTSLVDGLHLSVKKVARVQLLIYSHYMNQRVERGEKE